MYSGIKTFLKNSIETNIFPTEKNYIILCIHVYTVQNSLVLMSHPRCVYQTYTTQASFYQAWDHLEGIFIKTLCSSVSLILDDCK